MEGMAVDRRSVGSSRVPLDVLVELSHRGFEEPFEADGVNLGLGGLSMRAPYLPDVGARLLCRFATVDGGAAVEADAEVVWAEDKGSHNGEFGLRFLGLSSATQRAIRQMVMGDVSYVPPAPGSAAPQVETALEPGMARLRIDGVHSGIVAKVISRDEVGITLEQPLPFLCLHKGVTLDSEDGRRGRIEAVDLNFEGETPSLVLDIAFERAGRVVQVGTPPFPVPEAESTVPDAIPHHAASSEAVSGDPTPSDSTLPDFHPVSFVPVEPTPLDLALRAAAQAEGSPQEPAAAPVLPAVRVADPPPMPAEPAAAGAHPVVDALAKTVRATLPAADAASEDAAAVRAFAPTGVIPRAAAALSEMGQRIAPRVRLARGRLAELYARDAPLLVALHAWLLRGALALRSRVGPGLAVAWSRTRAVSAALLNRGQKILGRRFPRLVPAAARRRTTAPPPTASNVTVQVKRGRKVTVPLRRSRRRTLVISAVAFVGVAMIVYALAPSSDEDVGGEQIDVHREVVPVTRAPADPEQGDVSASSFDPGAPPIPPGAPVSVAQAAGAAPGVAPAMPAALTAPSRQAGPIPAPTFPSLREGSPAGQVLDPADDVTAEPTQGASPSSGDSFGAASVPNGRSFLIRTSRPVERIEGVALEDGFRVVIHGSLSLDRAGPIAAAHPMVERSMILNRGDHAELTINFVEGRRPAYRVVVRGSAVEVLIGPR